MTKQIINEIQSKISEYQFDLSILKNMLNVTTQMAEGTEEHSYSKGIVLHIKGQINRLKKNISELEKDLAYHSSVKNDKKIEAMFFKAGHRRFNSEEITEMLNDFRKFTKTPIEKEIDFGMSDEAKMFVSQNVEIKEAEVMWDYFLKNSFNDNDDCIMDYGDLLIWNGTDFIDDKGTPFAKLRKV